MQNDSPVSVQELSLPKGGGAIVGLGESLSPIGPSGMAGFSFPLPASAGQRYAPALALNYSSGTGNTAFGLGWQLAVAAIQRRTSHGVPRYDGGVEDEFLGPDGEVLVTERDANEKTITTTVNKYGSKDLGRSYQVTRYFPRVEGSFHRIERWQDASAADDFWLIHGAEGDLHCLGKTAGGRVADPSQPERIGEWRIEESVNPRGEHIYYRHVAENSDNVTADNEQNRDHAANRYLAEVFYGNRAPDADLYLWDTADASAQGWLFSIVLDYGERGVDLATAPPYAVPAGHKWPIRADSFSRYQYGFEARTHRLCRQILTFHHFPDELKADHTLVRRLLLTYRESPVVSQLVQARTLAYEPDGTMQSLPPLEFGYSTFDIKQLDGAYQIFDGVPELNDARHYQMVDLYGDGVPGVLFRLGTGWRYRPPVRGKAGTDEVAYGDWETLPAVPSMQPVPLALMDIDGDGRLDWLVAQPGMAGFFSLKEGNEWSGFTPFNALPPEFFHPEAQLADLVGAGLSDLALIGPTSVRLYANQRDGFMPGTDVPHDEGDLGLPIAGRSDREVVAFSDILGSGQSHLVRIRWDGVTCWPNLGRGRFGKPFQVAALDFDRDAFNPDQLIMADLDGSGAMDLIYIDQDHLTLYLNQSGNSFAAPITLKLPDGLTFDRLCRASFADLQGLGVASLVISHRHMAPTHWRLDFVKAKPYLLASVNNNMGAGTVLGYRSSVQYWLDDKAANPGLTSSLPVPIHTLAQTTTLDEITGNSLTSQYSFHKGVYDGAEREFRGFGLVTAQDAQQVAADAQSNVPFAPPLLSKTWYHTGREDDETALFDAPYRDAEAFVVKPTRLTRYDAQRKQDVDLDTVDTATRYWLFRSLKGLALRQETYGLDGSDKQEAPYTVSIRRYQARLVQPSADHASPVALPGELEEVDYSYERIAADPVVSQHVNLVRDQYGAVTWQVAVNYPRRPKPQTNPYPDSLPASSWDSGYDDQQSTLVLTERRVEPAHLDDVQAWRLSLPYQQRDNALVYDGTQVPNGGLSFEALAQAGGLLDAGKPRTYAGQRRTVYQDNPPTFIGLVDHIETAEFDDASLKAFDGALEGSARDALLKQAGYALGDRILSPGTNAEPQVWLASHDLTEYQPASGFYFPKNRRASSLTGPLSFEYDGHACALAKITDALGNETTAEYDYRFVRPTRIVDLNANTQEVLLDALGRVVASSFYGTEEGATVGFSPVATFSPRGLTVPQAIQDAGTKAQQVSAIQVEDVFSWMGQLDQASLKNITADATSLWSTLQACGFVTPDGWILAAGRAWAAGVDAMPGIPDQLRPLIQAAGGLPVQSATLLADRYPSDAAQQVRVSVAYFDGFGRALQQVQKAPPGLAWQRDPQGEIVVGQDGHPLTAQTSTRWAVSGKVEYDNKGQAVRSYQPYYVNDWRYVSDKAMRACGYADTHSYDATGREIQVLTAKGYLRRNGFFPWFTVAEDENDTFVQSVATVQLDVVDGADTAPADGKSVDRVQATVLDSDGDAVPGVLVTFQAGSPAIVAPASQGADGNGQAQANITSTTTGDIAVTAMAGGVASTPVTVHFTKPPAAVTVAKVALTVDPDYVQADGKAAATATAAVTMSDTSAAPDGTQVTFAASDGATVSPETASTSKGRATTSITSTTTGDSVVTAVAGGVAAIPATVHFTEIPATVTVAKVALTVDPDHAPADGKTAATATAVVTMSDTTAAPDGTKVTFTAGNGATENPATASTSNGRATTSITSTTAGKCDVTATSGAVKSDTATVQFSEVGQVSVDHILVLPLPGTQQAAADGVATIEVKATVTGTDGRPIADGTTVTFSADALANLGGTTTIDNQTATTSNGVASTTVRSTAKGNRKITAAAGVKTGWTTVYFGSGYNVAAIRLNVFPNNAAYRRMGTDVVYANVYIDGNKPAPKGVQVVLEEVLGNNLYISVHGGGASETDDLGIVTWDVQCGDAGTFNVQATTDNGKIAFTTVSFQAG